MFWCCAKLAYFSEYYCPDIHWNYYAGPGKTILISLGLSFLLFPYCKLGNSNKKASTKHFDEEHPKNKYKFPTEILISLVPNNTKQT